MKDINAAQGVENCVGILDIYGFEVFETNGSANVITSSAFIVFID
jgi:hypothetical protein